MVGHEVADKLYLVDYTESPITYRDTGVFAPNQSLVYSDARHIVRLRDKIEGVLRKEIPEEKSPFLQSFGQWTHARNWALWKARNYLY